MTRARPIRGRRSHRARARDRREAHRDGTIAATNRRFLRAFRLMLEAIHEDAGFTGLTTMTPVTMDAIDAVHARIREKRWPRSIEVVAHPMLPAGRALLVRRGVRISQDKVLGVVDLATLGAAT